MPVRRSCIAIARATLAVCLLIPSLNGQDANLSILSRRALSFAHERLVRTAETFSDTALFPRSTNPDGTWHGEKAEQWTSGFFPGLLWMMYGETGTTDMLGLARTFTDRLRHIKDHSRTHDVGFMIFSSYGRAYRLLGRPDDRDVILRTASTLASRYSPAVGAIKSWDNRAWPYPVIIDNMMNLELLLWAAANGGDAGLRDIAISHADRTREHHVRADGSTYHVVSFDSTTGDVLGKVTHQGASDESCWARGQAWAVYGFTMVYAYTREERFLGTAESCADYFIAHLPEDGVPHWDFQAPGFPDVDRDASAGAIAASGLLQLSRMASSAAKQSTYRAAAEKILTALARPPYLAQGTPSQGILNHAVGHMPKNSEVDVSLIYADYYFIEALLRHKRMVEEEVFEAVVRMDGDRILARAAEELQRVPVTITAFPAIRSAGGPHDFYSEGDYWWPDSSNPEGPYIRKDGQTNPDNFVRHREAMIACADAVSTLTAAAIVSKDRSFADHALRHLDAWFTDEETRMNPSLTYAQAIFGRVTGRGIGIIDTIHLLDIARAVGALGSLPGIPQDALNGVRAWFRDYLLWLTTHQYGLDEMAAKNNHGTWWVAQVAAFSEAVGDTARQSMCADRFLDVLLPGQMGEDGGFPLELSRTKPYNYALFNLEGMAVISTLLSRPGRDLWTFTLPDGRGMEKGMAFMQPHVPDKSTWPYPKDVMYFDDYPGRHSSFLLAASAIGPSPWIGIWEQLPVEPANNEVRRSLPIVQPLLWTIPGTFPW